MRIIPIVLALIVGLVTPAFADTGELTATTTLDTFSSSGDVYGPWQTELLEYQWQAGKRDIPSVTILNRNDRDRDVFGNARPSGSTALYLDDYHNWSGSFFTYAQVMTSNGTILPNRLFYVEADLKAGRRRNVVLGAGGSAYANPDGSATRSLSLGPTLYEGSMVYTARYLPAAVTGRFTGVDSSGRGVAGTINAYGSALEFIAEYNRLGRDQVIATYLGGNQPGILVGSIGTLPAQFTNIQHLGEVDLSVKHWVRGDFGFIVGASVATHSMQATGTKLYGLSAVTAGLFFGRAVGLPR